MEVSQGQNNNLEMDQKKVSMRKDANMIQYFW
jgi:hypothetical protein